MSPAQNRAAMLTKAAHRDTWTAMACLFVGGLTCALTWRWGVSGSVSLLCLSIIPGLVTLILALMFAGFVRCAYQGFQDASKIGGGE